MTEENKEIPIISLTPQEAARCCGLSRTRIFQAIRKNEMTARKSGKSTVIEMEELKRWLHSLPTRGREPGVTVTWTDKADNGAAVVQ